MTMARSAGTPARLAVIAPPVASGGSMRPCASRFRVNGWLRAPGTWPARASIATPVCLLVRKPSRRVVAELSSLLAVSPIVLGLSALILRLLAKDPADHLVCVFNLTPVARHGYRVGVPHHRPYQELLNSDALAYGGSGVGNLGTVHADDNGRATMVLPPLGVLWLGHRA